MALNVLIDERALIDLQAAIDYYDYKQVGLGEKFESVANKYITQLSESPYFQIRYDEVRCLPIKNFPFMIHYSIDEKKQTIIIWAILHTSLNPDKWELRNK